MRNFFEPNFARTAVLRHLRIGASFRPDSQGMARMTQFTIASFNVKNLIGPDKEYYRFQSYTPRKALSR